MAKWEILKIFGEYRSEKLFIEHILPIIKQAHHVHDAHQSSDAFYVLVSSYPHTSKKILIVQYRIEKNQMGFRILDEEIQPFNFSCPAKMLAESTNKDPKAAEWREANSNPIIRKKIVTNISDEALHLADDFETVKQWRTYLQKGAEINSAEYGLVIFNRACNILIQFLYVHDRFGQEIYCHVNDFTPDEINKAIESWNLKIQKSSTGCWICSYRDSLKT